MRRVGGCVALGGWMAAQAQAVTHVEVTATALRSGVQRMGINLGEETFYDSGMMLKNLVARNPGFEGMEYRSVVRCEAAGNVCVTEDGAEAWPAGFWDGAECEWVDGGGACGVVRWAKEGGKLRLVLRGAARSGYVVLRKGFPGDAAAGWWPEVVGGGAIEAERKDLSAETKGRQAVRLEAAGAGQRAAVMAYFDTTEGRTFLRMEGTYRLRLRAKGVGGARTLGVSLVRQSSPAETFFNRTVTLTGAWQDLNYDIAAYDAAGAIGPVRLRLEASGSSVLVDDVSLERVGDAGNATAFRDEVVAALKELRPGVIRYVGGQTALGASAAELLGPVEARERAGFSVWSARQEEIPIGVPELLGLCRTVGADPWVVVPVGSSAAEMREMVSYLAAHGRGFGTIHVELGNEVWNSVFRGATIEDPVAYGRRAATLFAAARSAPGFDARRFDLVVGGQAVVPYRNGQLLDAVKGADSLAIAPYLMHSVTDEGSIEKLFGPLFAQPQEMEGTAGVVREEAEVASRHGVKLEVYEVNLHTTEGTISQRALDQLAPSLGAGLTVGEHMLLMLRDAGVRAESLFSLAGFDYRRQDGKRVRLWGSVVDMGVTNRRRPQFLVEELINRAILSTLVVTRQSGADPSWMQAAGNDGVTAGRRQMIESFAFSDGGRHSIVLLNLSRDIGLPVDFMGAGAPRGRVTVSTLSGEAVDATNEESERVRIVEREVSGFDPGKAFMLPAASMTVLRWQGSASH